MDRLLDVAGSAARRLGDMFDVAPVSYDPLASKPLTGSTAGGFDPLQGKPFRGGFDPLGGSPAGASYDPLANKPFGPRMSTIQGKPVPVGGGLGAGAGAAGTVSGGGGASTGLKPGVAQWAGQVQQTFGDIMDPDVMLAIIQHESGGDPHAYNATGNAYGLFQQVGLNSWDPQQQMQAARALAQQKLAGIEDAYRKNGLNPDQRTRARDFQLAWGGHFDYSTGLPNPSSRDIGSGQTAQQLADEFYAIYDGIKSGRQQAAPGNPGGGTGFSSIWGGGNAPISQEFGVVSPGVDQGIYTYGQQFGMEGGHTGLDIGVKRGTQLYLPTGFGGTVIEHAPGYYRDEDYGDDGQSYERGELRIRLDNGWELILGHNSRNLVHPGDRVTAGQALALSGSAAGDHVHIELRIPDSSTPSGWRIVDPRQYLR